MKKRFCRQSTLIAIVSAMILAAGCGSSGGSAAKSESYMSSYDTMGSNAVYEEAAMADVDYAFKSDNAPAAPVADTSRKLITTMNISAETDDLTSVVTGVENKVKELGGYIESSNISNHTTYSSKISRSASITCRIPKDKLDSFTELVEGSTNITNKSMNVEDVTLSYVDIESRKNALKTEEKRLLEILESAETVEDIITVEDKLSDVRYELESIESQLRSYDNRIDYSTVYLNIDEVATFTPVEKESAVSRMGKGFMQSIGEVVEAVVEFAVWFVSHIPQMILIIIVIVIVVIIIRLIDKNSKKRRIRKMQKMQSAQMYAPGQNAPASPGRNTPASPGQNAPVNPQKDNADGNK